MVIKQQTSNAAIDYAEPQLKGQNWLLKVEEARSKRDEAKAKEQHNFIYKHINQYDEHLLMFVL